MIFSALDRIKEYKVRVVNYVSRRKKRIAICTGISLLVLITIFGIWVLATLSSIRSGLPSVDRLVSETKRSTVIYDREGGELFRFFDEKDRTFVSLGDVPDSLKWSIIAAEDADFYEHEGFDIPRLLYCMASTTLHYVTGGGSGAICGASTLSQQAVRTAILPEYIGDRATERSIYRKLYEVLVTYEVEREYSKNQILQVYINEIPLGGTHYGFQSAAKSYLDKDVANLTLAEAALLAGLVQQPSTYNPIWGTSPEMAITRQNYVFDQLERYTEKTGISVDEIESARQEGIALTSGSSIITAPHFVFYVLDEVEREFPDIEIENGVSIYTTLDPDLQHVVEEAVVRGVDTFGADYNVHNGAAAAVDPRDFSINAMVGSVDYWSSSDQVSGSFNVTLAPRQLGSSVKPYTYLTAIEQGYGMWMMTPDIPAMGDAYDILNADGDFDGLISARKALVRSRNISAVYVAELIGIPALLDTYDRVGITSIDEDMDLGLGLTLGEAELSLLENVSGFAVFAAGGVSKPVYAIEKIEGSDGQVLFEKEETEGDRVFAAGDIYQLNWALCDLDGFGDRLHGELYDVGGVGVCGKTGTSDGPRDLVSMQYHRNLVVGVWAGNNDNSEIMGAWSYDVSLPIAQDIMNRSTGWYKPALFDKPVGVQEGEICIDTGRLVGELPCPREQTVFTENNRPSMDSRELIEVCVENGLLPTNPEEVDLVRHDFNILESRLVMDIDLEFSKYQHTYEDYLAQLYPGVLFTKPGSAACPLPENTVADPGGGGATIYNEEPSFYSVSPGESEEYWQTAAHTLWITATIVSYSANDTVNAYVDGALVDTQDLEYAIDEYGDNVARYEYAYAIPEGIELGDHEVIITVKNSSNGKSYSITRTFVIIPDP